MVPGSCRTGLCLNDGTQLRDELVPSIFRVGNLTRGAADALRHIRSRQAIASIDVDVPGASLADVFRQGVIVNVLNPHTALFFFAFLPQFVTASKGHVALQIASLGLLFVGLSAATDSGWAVAAGAAGRWLRSNKTFARRQRYVTGGVLIGLGAATALSGHVKTSAR